MSTDVKKALPQKFFWQITELISLPSETLPNHQKRHFLRHKPKCGVIWRGDSRKIILQVEKKWVNGKGVWRSGKTKNWIINWQQRKLKSSTVHPIESPKGSALLKIRKEREETLKRRSDLKSNSQSPFPTPCSWASSPHSLQWDWSFIPWRQ